MSNVRKETILEIADFEIPSNQFEVEKTAMDVFGDNVFSEQTMRLRVPKNIFKQFKKSIDEGTPIDNNVADVIATSMKDWALEKGATHFTHLFFPMTGSSAEKHDSFLVPTEGGQAIEQFSGKELIKGEPDASSFPSGGIRATFEARGYTAWDPTSPAFIVDSPNGATLTIPTAFWSYTGEALDKKTPLLKSQQALLVEANKIFKLFGEKEEAVIPSVGAEQEYFLIDKKFYLQRPDLIATGRTLFGAASEKGQQLDDHYFGTIKDRVLAFMEEVEFEAYKLGIPVKTRHNEVAPGEFEIAPLYERANLAADHNIILMDILKKIADKYGFACLMHEKPFAGINGNGKHNNWSIITGSGKNLIDPGKNPEDNKMFLIFLSAVIRGVNKWAKLLRASVASAGNDHRLGANEAPPAIISIFLGEALDSVVNSIINGTPISDGSGDVMKLGITSIPEIPKDNTDRNRTSPFAFTGNKFEFRALGSNFNVAGPNIVINTAVAESLDIISAEIEKLKKSGKDINEAAQEVIKNVLKENYDVVFNGNNYSDEWLVEAEKRGLPNLKATPEALDTLVDSDSIELFKKYNVFSEKESRARHAILKEQYATIIEIEARLTANLAKTTIFPAAVSYQGELANSIITTSEVLGNDAVTEQKELLAQIAENINKLNLASDKLRANIDSLPQDESKVAEYCRDILKPAMDDARKFADNLELLVDDEYWPLPKYREMLFIY